MKTTKTAFDNRDYNVCDLTFFLMASNGAVQISEKNSIDCKDSYAGFYMLVRCFATKGIKV